MELTLEIIIVFIGIDWLIQFILALLTYFSVEPLDTFTEKLTDWPGLSVIVPAANEEDVIEEATRAKLSSDYPDVEFLLINDRSSDKTKEIMQKLALEDKRVKFIDIERLPDGWLGKLNAMNVGVKEARGDWLLFSDADVHYSKDTLKKAISYAEINNLDHLVVAPQLWGKNIWLKASYVVFARIVSLLFRIWKMKDQNSKAAGGAGAFNLVRRKAYEKTEGFEFLKMEVADDIGLGVMLKSSGAKSAAVIGGKLAGLYYYESVGDMLRGLERATFTTMGNFSAIKVVAQASIMAFEMIPFLVFFVNISSVIFYVGIGTMILSFFTHYIFARGFGSKMWHSLFWPVGASLLIFMTVRAAFVGRKRKGIYWRGTFYKEDELKRGKRYFA